LGSLGAAGTCAGRARAAGSRPGATDAGAGRAGARGGAGGTRSGGVWAGYPGLADSLTRSAARQPAHQDEPRVARSGRLLGTQRTIDPLLTRRRCRPRKPAPRSRQGRVGRQAHRGTGRRRSRRLQPMGWPPRGRRRSVKASDGRAGAREAPAVAASAAPGAASGAAGTADPVASGAQRDGDSTGAFPFTGSGVLLVAALGLLALGAGLALRRGARRVTRAGA
jgi:hypothetical protein